MKKIYLLLVMFAAITMTGQNRNYYIVINDTAEVGMYSTRSGLIFTEEVDVEVMDNIKANFNEKIYRQRNWDLSDFNFEEEYFSFDAKGELLGKLSTEYNESSEIIDDDILKLNSNANYVSKASGRYILSETIALGGTAVSLALSQDDPLAAANILAATSLISYCIRISGHVTLGKHVNN